MGVAVAVDDDDVVFVSSIFSEVGVSTLKQLALTKGPYVPTLNVMVPYLDFSSNQEYLVKRLKGKSDIIEP